MFNNNEIYGGGLLGQLRRLIVTDIYGSHYTRGTLEQDRYFFGSVTGPEHMMTHRIVLDGELNNFQEGGGVATTTGGSPIGGPAAGAQTTGAGL